MTSPPTSVRSAERGSPPRSPSRVPSPPSVLPKLPIDGEDGNDTFGLELLELARRQETENEALLHFLSGPSHADSLPAGSIQGEPTTQQRGLNSAALSDDLIPSTDPCYLNLSLRDVTVRLLHSITSQSIYTFITSLAQDSHQIYFGSSSGHDQPVFGEDEKDMIMSDIRLRIRRSTERNRAALCQNARLETQLVVAQHLLEARSRTPPGLDISVEDQQYADQIAQVVALQLKQMTESREEGSTDGLTIRKLISVTGNVFWDQLPIPSLSNS